MAPRDPCLRPPLARGQGGRAHALARRRARWGRWGADSWGGGGRADGLSKNQPYGPRGTSASVCLCVYVAVESIAVVCGLWSVFVCLVWGCCGAATGDLLYQRCRFSPLQLAKVRICTFESVGQSAGECGRVRQSAGECGAECRRVRESAGECGRV